MRMSGPMISKRIRRLFVFWGIGLGMLISISFVPGVFADDFHYVNMIVGNRASGMGGAYTALSDDPAGCYYNPAGIAFAPNFSLSASANAYQLSVKTYKDVLTKTDGSRQDWKQESSSLLPNFFGVVKRLDIGMIGLSYAVTDAVQRRQKQYFDNIASVYADNPVSTYMININDSDKTYLFGPTYAYALNSALSVGATLYTYYRDREIIRNQLLQFAQGEHILANYYETKIDWGVKPSIGLIWEPVDRLALGLTLSKIIVFSDNTQRHDIYRNTSSDASEVIGSLEYDFSDTDTIYFKSVESDEKDKFPFTTKLGCAYFFSPKFLLSGDISYYAKVDEKKALFNFNLGGEYYLTDSLAVRMGLFSDMANTDEVRSGGVNQDENIDIYGSNLSVTLFQRMSSITMGMSYGFGSGDAQMITDSTQIQKAEIQNLTLYLSASYNY